MDNEFIIADNSILKNYISLMWQSSGSPDYKKEMIVPSGTVEIIFNFSENLFTAQIGSNSLSVKKSFINGFNTNPIFLQVPAFHSFFGVRFHPFVIRHLFRFNAGEFANRTIDLALIDPFFNSLWHQLYEAKDFSKRVSIFKTWLLKKSNEVIPRMHSVDMFLNNEAERKYSVATLSKTLYSSPRQLSRKFYQLTGMNTSHILTYKNYLKSLELMENPKLSLTEICYSCHFSDQSHFIKVFKDFAGITPGEYRKQKSFLKGHIFFQ
jgi:AraC-like DNA-binding protein